MLGNLIKRVLWLLFVGSLIIAVMRVMGGTDFTHDPVGWTLRASDTVANWFRNELYPSVVKPVVDAITSTDPHIDLPSTSTSTPVGGANG